MKGFLPIKFLILTILIGLIAISAQDAPPPTDDKAKAEDGATKPADTKPEEKPKSDTGTEPATGATIYVNSKTSFELKASDDSTQVDYIEYKINSSDFRKYTNPIFLNEEGQSTISYRAVDKAENKEPLKALQVIVDNTAPTATITPSEPLYVSEGKNFASSKTTYSFKAEDKSSGVKKIEFALDNEAKAEYKNDAVKLNKPGMQVIKYTATDNAGNSSAEYSFVVHVDDVKPGVEIQESNAFIPMDGKNFIKKGTTFTVKATDGESGVSKVLVKIDNAGEFAPYTEHISITAAGEHTIEAKSVDNVGNESEIKKVTFSVDANPPTTTIKTVPPSSAPQQ